MILLGFFLVAQAAANAASASAADMAHVSRRAQPVLDRYYQAVVDCGARPPFKPTIAVSPTEGIIHYEPTGHVVLYPYSVANGEMRTYAEARGGGDARVAREAYESIFNDLLVAHELGHWLRSFQPERRTADGEFDNWLSEYDANRLMVAYWREHSSSREAGERRLTSFAGPEEANPVPPPEGMSVETFFTRRTMTIVRGGAYGWYQGLMVRRALAERPQPRFCDLVAEWLPLRD